MFADELRACIALRKRGLEVEDWCFWDGSGPDSQRGGDGRAEDKAGRGGRGDGKGEPDEVVDAFDVLFFEAADA